ncbi:5'-methylthioadenosine/adenosylhomocysteine nucleosidase [Youxingia wuxianensis]|uniref:adenosylhomocysteine nucleosidase n=1 Tax=Youxingia wuxianensis TaxID=2763678 RepID=A0A926ER51_9FIRM|nr:5'-methylthioadenosine/adenosylhomocysteine nucleosidase [Youxingia wuxianensis]MBC8585004.1 5'-methylthioadenosine/adenosylhomocysteine nucleosidase [Youxingia wuxianensis]
MTKIGVLCAMDSELALLKEEFSDGRMEKIGFFSFYIAVRGNKNIIVGQSGIGKVNAAAYTQILISHFGVDVVINSGVAGALSKELNVFDVAISDEVTEHDIEQGVLEDYLPFRSIFCADKALSALAQEICREKNIHCISGRIVSGDRFITDSKVKEDIISRTGGVAVEMEGAATGHVCYLNSIPFLVVRCISDNADDQGDITYEEFSSKAAQLCAQITLGLIERI